eukprot:5209208-Pyramimonas_sp.AAC.1
MLRAIELHGIGSRIESYLGTDARHRGGAHSCRGDTRRGAGCAGSGRATRNSADAVGLFQRALPSVGVGNRLLTEGGLVWGKGR